MIDLDGMDILIPEPKLPEFRLYYDEKGDILFYTCDRPEGNYVVIDAQTYASGRYDIRVKDGEIIYTSDIITIHTMSVSDNGTRCAVEDVNIIVDDGYKGETLDWKVKIHEFRNS